MRNVCSRVQGNMFFNNKEVSLNVRDSKYHDNHDESDRQCLQLRLKTRNSNIWKKQAIFTEMLPGIYLLLKLMEFVCVCVSTTHESYRVNIFVDFFTFLNFGSCGKFCDRN